MGGNMFEGLGRLLGCLSVLALVGVVALCYWGCHAVAWVVGHVVVLW